MNIIARYAFKLLPRGYHPGSAFHRSVYHSDFGYRFRAMLRDLGLMEPAKMPRNLHERSFFRKDGQQEITLFYTFKPGTPDSWFEPGDPPEVEIYDAKMERFGRTWTVFLTSDEERKALDDIFENHEEDDPSDYEDWRD